MQITPFSDDLYDVIKRAGAVSKKYYQTFCGTPHLFLSLFNTLSKNKETPRYGEVYKNLREIINEYNVNGQTFEKSFLEFCPKGMEPKEGEKLEIHTDREYKKIVEELQRDSIAKKRSMEIEDLIMALFSDRSYTIFTIFSDITGSDAKTEEMYDKIIKAFKPSVTAEIKELEEIQELKNLNKWVKAHPQTVIDADEPISKIEMALSGRSIRNVILTGPAGTGKTTYVYELAQRINKGNVPEQFLGKVIYELDPGALLAGTRYRGKQNCLLQQ